DLPFAPQNGGADLVAARAACVAWQVAPDTAPKRVSGAIPTLVISGEKDTVAPPAHGALLSGQLGKATHVVVPGAGPDVVSACVREIVKAFVQSGGAAPVDTGCLSAR
ncbi:MAG: alpha/beta hydrolase, partial [Acidobacteriota bacterium]|nr:alpha/beta hydrolase [Acidobacteriota bacterium]